jgi:uncharacterized protein YndB with AHSA1/START domain
MATNSQTLRIEAVGELEIRITREFDAPRPLVFRMFTSCEHLSRWLGPRDMEMTFCEMDFRVGGRYRYVHRNAGGEYGFRGEILEIDEPRRISQTFEFEGMPGHISVDTLELEELSSRRTRLVNVSRFASLEDRDGMLASDMESGVRDGYDRLEEILAAGSD